MTKHKVLMLLLSFAIACGLWLYVVSNVSTDDSQWIHNIPVTFVNEDGLFADRNLTLSAVETPTVSLKFHGSRQDLLKLSNSNITITADLSTVTDEGEWDLSYDYELPETVNANNIYVESRSSYSVKVNVDKLAVKTIEVKAVFTGDVAENYIAEAIEMDSDTIDISGPQEQVENVSYAQVTLERTNVTQTISDVLPVTLYDEEGNEIKSDEITCSMDEISVMMPVSMLKEIPLTVTFIDGGGATEDYAVATIEPSSITVKGDAETLENMNSISVATIYLGNIADTYSEDVDIVIPDGMVNMTGSQATVSVQLYNLKEKTFRITNIELTNAPENLHTTLGTLSLSVTLRGPDASINAITSSNIRAVADLSSVGSTTGQFSVPVTIYVDGYSDVGYMGSYTVLVSISEETTEETPVEVSTEPSAEEGTVEETEEEAAE